MQITNLISVWELLYLSTHIPEEWARSDKVDVEVKHKPEMSRSREILRNVTNRVVAFLFKKFGKLFKILPNGERLRYQGPWAKLNMHFDDGPYHLRVNLRIPRAGVLPNPNKIHFHDRSVGTNRDVNQFTHTVELGAGQVR